MNAISKALVIVAVTCASSLWSRASSEQAEPWLPLFHGEDLKGWKLVGDEGRAEVVDGEIVCHMVRGTAEHTFVCSEKIYSDFILELEYRAEGSVNSAILVRANAAPEEAEVSLVGYSMKIDETPRAWTGGIFYSFGGGKSKWLFAPADDARARGAFRLNDWNHFRIEAIGDQLRTWVNGVPVANLLNADHSKGHIAFKIHSLGASARDAERLAEIPFRFRNARILTTDAARYARPMDVPPRSAP